MTRLMAATTERGESGKCPEGVCNFGGRIEAGYGFRESPFEMVRFSLKALNHAFELLKIFIQDMGLNSHIITWEAVFLMLLQVKWE